MYGALLLLPSLEYGPRALTLVWGASAAVMVLSWCALWAINRWAPAQLQRSWEDVIAEALKALPLGDGSGALVESGAATSSA